jgi:hypothetical protein
VTDGPPATGSRNRITLALGWIVCAVALSFGGAGIVTGVGGPPGTSSRPELTLAGDGTVTPLLQSATDDLGRLRDHVDQLGTDARGALAATIGGDQKALNEAITTGTTMTGQITTETAALRARLAALPGFEDATTLPLPPELGLRLSASVQHRYAQLVASLDATNGLADAWLSLTGAAQAARQLSDIFSAHDAATAQAARLGTQAKYAAALKQLDASDDAMANAKTMRNQLVKAVDVSTLDQWLARYAAYDAALRKLYTILRSTNGRFTKAAQAAFRAEEDARKGLPGDTRALVVIMGDVAKGGLNQAVITIELAKGRLNDALDALGSAEPGATASPGPSDQP